MASTHPTCLSLYKAITAEGVDTLEKAISIIEPQTDMDRIARWGMGLDRDFLLDGLLKFDPPQDKATFKRLGFAIIDSHIERAHRDNFENGLNVLLRRALTTQRGEWILAAMEHAFHAAFSLHDHSGERLLDWVQNQDRYTQQEVARYALRAMRYRGLAQNSRQAGRILDLVNTLLEIDEELLADWRAVDIEALERVENKAEQDAGPIKVFAKRAVLAQIAGPAKAAPPPKL